MVRYRLLLILTLAICGCGGNDQGLIPVSGTVTYKDGPPVVGEMATIVFHPDTSSGNPSVKSASGTIQPDGRFTLMTVQPDDGAAPGNYKVVLKVWSDYRAQKLAVPPQYADEATTPLRASVAEDAAELNFTVDR